MLTNIGKRDNILNADAIKSQHENVTAKQFHDRNFLIKKKKEKVKTKLDN